MHRHRHACRPELLKSCQSLGYMTFNSTSRLQTKLHCSTALEICASAAGSETLHSPPTVEASYLRSTHVVTMLRHMPSCHLVPVGHRTVFCTQQRTAAPAGNACALSRFMTATVLISCTLSFFLTSENPRGGKAYLIRGANEF